MRSRFYIVAVAVITLWPTFAAAQDPNVEIMKKLFTKLGTIVGVESQTSDTFLVLANPGTLIDPKLDMKNGDDQYQLSKVLDKVMSPSWVYHPTNKQTLPLYKLVLDFHEAPAKKIEPAQQLLLDKARVWIYGSRDGKAYTDDFKSYRAAKGALATALDDINDFQSAHPGAPLSNALADALDNATSDYNNVNTHPDGGTFAADENTVNVYGHLDPAIWWAQNLTQFTLNVGNYNGGPFARYNLYPSYSQWTDPNKKWTTIALTQSDLEQTTSSSHTSVGGGFSAGWGLWSVGADYSRQEDRTYFKLDVTGYSLSFEIMRVELDRPWMNDYVFQSRAWRWLNSAPLGSADKNISDGASAAAGATPTGFMPFLPTALLLARNVTLSGGWSSDLKTTFDSQTSSGGSIGWGPFSFGGRTNTSESSTYTKANAAGNTINFGAPQIIGYFVEVLPPSPFQDPSLNWPPKGAAPTPTTDKLLKRALDILSQIKAKQKQ